MRIPLNEKYDIVKEKLKIPTIYIIPVFIEVGHPAPNENEFGQQVVNINKQLHFGRWK